MLIQIYNKEHVKTNAYNTTDLKETINLDDKEIIFTMPLNLINEVENEGYIRTNKDEYVIKTVKPSKTYITIEAVLNLENLQGKPLESFSSVEKTIDDCVRLAIAGTGWTVKSSGLTKKRTIKKDGTNALEIIKQALKTYICEVEFDSINKTIHFVEKRGTNKGSYAIEDFNNTAISLDSNSDKFFTYIVAYGKAKQDGTQIHCTVENHQYSDKMIGLYWKDERYTNIDSLREDATYKLNELSKPRKSYSVSADYFDNSIDIGDTIMLISKDKNIKEKQRVTKIVKYYDEQGKDTIEVANTMLSFEDIQKEQQETQETVSNITEDNGTISLKAMQNGWIELNKVNIQDLNAIRANIGTLNANEVIADELHAHKADISNLKADKADITDLTASNLSFNTATGGTLDLQTLLSQFIIGSQGQYLNLTGDNVVIANALIKDAMIDSINASKINAGSVDTSKVAIQSADGTLKLWGDLLQFKDKNGNVRIQMGLDGNKVYSLKIADAKGNLLFDTDGATAKGLHSGIITNAHVADNANINGKKIDIDSLITEVNNGTSVIKSSKVQIDTAGQTLDVAFNTLKSNVDNIHVEGRNLIRNSSFDNNDYTGWSYWFLNDSNNMTLSIVDDATRYNKKTLQAMANSSVTKTNGGLVIIPINNIGSNILVLGEEYVFSCYVKVNSSGTYSILAENSTSFDEEKIELNASVWTYVSRRFKLGREDFSIHFYKHDWTKGDTIKINSPKLEKGGKASLWTAAPEDFPKVADILQTKIEVNNGKIATLVKDTTITKDGKDIKLKDAYSSLEQNVNGFETKVANAKTEAINTSKEYTDNSVNTVIKRVETAESSITQLSDSITSKVSKTEFENLQVGGRNLYSGTKYFSGSSWINKANYTVETEKFKGYTVCKRAGAWMGLCQLIDAEQGEYYTLSAYIKCSESTKIHPTWVTGSTTGSSASEAKLVKTNCSLVDETWKRIYYTFEITKSGKMSPSFESSSQTNTMFICAIKLEKGTKNTDYTEAPEDVQEQINNVVQRVSTAEQKITPTAIVSTVTSSATYKNNLNSKVDTSTYNSKIEQLSNMISTKVESNNFGSMIEQRPKNIMIGFNKINSNLIIAENYFKMTLSNGNTLLQATEDGLLIGGSSTKIANSVDILNESANRIISLENSDALSIILKDKHGNYYATPAQFGGTEIQFNVDIKGTNKKLGSSGKGFSEAWFGGYKKANTGYTALPNGMVMEWGYTTINGSSAPTWVAFPLTFSITQPVVTATVVGGNLTSGVNHTVWIESYNQYGFNARSSVPCNIKYIAIGW